jgi:hypothetical protein
MGKSLTWVSLSRDNRIAGSPRGLSQFDAKGAKGGTANVHIVAR